MHYIHDWEVQAAYLAYRKRQFDPALAMMDKEYGENIPRHNPHFIMGTMKAHPQTFIIIGVLRSPLDPAELDKQGGYLGEASEPHLSDQPVAALAE